MHKFITIPPQLRREIDEFLKESAPAKAIVAETRIENGDRRYQACVKFLFHRSGENPIALYHVSQTPIFLTEIKDWEDVHIPEFDLWESVWEVLRAGAIRVARASGTSPHELVITFEIGKTIQVKSIGPKTWGQGKLLNHYAVELCNGKDRKRP